MTTYGESVIKREQVARQKTDHTEVASSSLFTLHHVKEDRQDRLAKLRLWHEGDFKERPHHTGHKLDLVVSWTRTGILTELIK